MNEQVNRIIDAVCRYCGVRRDELLGRRRSQFIVAARSIAIKLLNEYTCYSYKEIGAIMGIKNMTVAYHIDGHDMRVRYQKSYKLLYEGTKRELERELDEQ